MKAAGLGQITYLNTFACIAHKMAGSSNLRWWWQWWWCRWYLSLES